MQSLYSQSNAGIAIGAGSFRMSNLEFLLGGDIFQVQSLITHPARAPLAQGLRQGPIHMHSLVSADIIGLF
jgi:hypothetical protein